MGIEETVGRVDTEAIYRHVLHLEGSREPLDSPERLDEAADYILSEFEKQGLSVSEHRFTVEGLDRTFRNIEAGIGDENTFFLVSFHYDTVPGSPGADDNSTGVAVMLETARALAEEDVSGIRFVSFTLEEQDPRLELRRREARRRLGLTDDRHRHTSARTQRNFRLLRQFVDQAYSRGQKLHEALLEARTKYEAQLTKAETEYLQTLEEMYRGGAASSPDEDLALGSSRWLQEALGKGKHVSGLINFEMVGFTSDQESSQTFPKGMTPGKPPFDFRTHNVKDFTVGNYLFSFGNANAGRLFESFCTSCESGLVDLPYSALHLPFPYDFIASNMRDVLRSDHASFWRARIPGLFLTDSANFRYPYYHTPADTIDRLDFDFMTKVAKATVATMLELCVNNRARVASA